jgi:hypothetical protein
MGTRAGAKTLPPIGIFGVFEALSLVFEPGTLANVKEVYGQDLRGDAASTLTGSVGINRTHDVLIIEGRIIQSVGTAAMSSPKELSEPGMVLVLEV